MILLDTHVFIWLVNGDKKLSGNYLEILKEEQNICLSVISCWEISLLLEKDRISIKNSFSEWIQDSIKAYDIEIVNLDLDIIRTYHQLNDLHSDPADKLISATSICKKIPLLTFDKKLIDYKGLNIVSA